jgi:aryl carrier-like protein/NRPS condensation-like uncharacterized protein
MIERAGQNSILGNSIITNGDRGSLSEGTPINPPTASEQPFEWTQKTSSIREEIAKLASVDEDSVLEHSSIFELGLDSIDVIKLASRLKKQGINIPVSAIIRSQSISKMANNITSHDTGSSISTGKFISDMGNDLKLYLESTGKLPRDAQVVLPATPLQQSMVNEMVNSGYKRYFNVDGFKLNDGVDLEKLLVAVLQVVERSPILRTTFVEINDPSSSVSYAQIVHQSLPQLQDSIMTTKLPEGQSFESFMEHFKHVAICYAKQRQELLQLQAISTGDANYLVIAISHALYDGASLRSIHEDIQRAYNDTLSPRPDFIPFIEQVFQSTTEDAKQFWKTNLSNLPTARYPKKELPQVDESEESAPLERRSRVPLHDIEALCKASRITLQTLGQTCWALVLSHLMGQFDVVFGSVLSCRDSEEAGEVMFPLMNTVAVRSVLHGTLDQMLAYMQEMSDMTRQYQHFPLGKAQAYAMASRQDQDHNGDTTLFDTLFIYQGRRSTTGKVPLYEAIYGVSDVEFPVCVEMEVVDDSYLSWTTKCKSIARNRAETEGILDFLETVLERLVSAPQEQTIVSEADGVSVCGLPKFQIVEVRPTLAQSQMKTKMSDRWSQTELDIRRALHQISDVSEDTIQKETTIFHLGLDSILILKLPALLKTYGIKLSVSTILRDQTIYAMAISAQGNIQETSDSFDVDAVLASAVSDMDLSGELGQLEKDVGGVQYAIPATAGQTYMIRQWQATRGAMFYHTFTYELPDSLDKGALDSAWTHLLNRHDILRTGFIDMGSKIIQVVFKDPANEIIYHSGPGSAITRKQNADLKLPAVNLVVEQVNASAHVLKLVLHHVLYDGISLSILVKELQALYYGQTLASSPQNFRNFVANSISSSVTAKEKWTDYLSTETLFPSKQVQLEDSIQRAEVFHPSNAISNIKLLGQEIGVSVDALFLAAIAKTLAQDLLADGNAQEQKHEQEQVTFGIYLANRAPFGEDLSNLAAPTLNLLPLCVKQPLEKGVTEIASEVQRDLNRVGEREMVGASLEEIQEWTGVRVNVFVNILKTENPGVEADITSKSGEGEDQIKEDWKSLQSLGRRGIITEESFNEKMTVPKHGGAYLVCFLPSYTLPLPTLCTEPQERNECANNKYSRV